MPRNTQVEKAVNVALARIDAMISGSEPVLPAPASRHACDKQLEHRAGSVRLASLFLSFYSVEEKEWDCESVPTGIRGKYGDKLLAEQLTQRNVTLHDAVTAFGENLGWKGNVVNVRLSTDPRFSEFCQTLKSSSVQARQRIAGYMAYRFADSRRELKPLPPVGEDVLTFARAKSLFSSLLALPTEGHLQQFLIAALLAVHRRRHGVEIRTHHPHASDKFDATAGDIEEFLDGRLLRAYEVTVRPDWKNRLSSFKAKMDEYGLAKYVIIASNVNSDAELAEPANLLTFVEPVGRDFAVVDIEDVTFVMAAELSAAELREAVNLTYDYLCQPKLCGRVEFQDSFRGVVDRWLDDVSTE